MKNETLIELQNRIYNQNVEMGWHDKPRSFNTFVCLFHSELSEAMEGLRKNLMDDHLPQYPMFQVELADFVIRCFDYLGSIYNANYYVVDFPVVGEVSEIDMIAYLHHSVSESMNLKLSAKGNSGCIATAIKGCFDFADKKGFDLLQIINEKIDYNKHRADHKRENRAKSNGKKF